MQPVGEAKVAPQQFVCGARCGATSVWVCNERLCIAHVGSLYSLQETAANFTHTAAQRQHKPWAGPCHSGAAGSWVHAVTVIG